MQFDRFWTLFLILAIFAPLMAVVGCVARGTEPPVIEVVGPPPPGTPVDTIRIATANLWGVSVFGMDWADDIDERFAAMAERLELNEARLDVVLIQEAWKDHARRLLLAHQGVIQNFPYRVDVVDRPGGAGLVILSRFPIESAHFERFQAQGRCIKFWEGDCIAGKGVLVVQVKVGDRSIWIANTHLIACYSRVDEPESACDLQDPNGEDRWLQLIEARRTIERLVGPEPVVLGGDFNFIRSSRYYPLMTNPTLASKRSTPSEEAARSVESTSASVTVQTTASRGWTESKEESIVRDRLDYFWTRPGTELRWRTRNPVRPIFTQPVLLRSAERVPLSDHPVLMTEICLVRIDDLSDRCLPFRSNLPAKD